MVANLANHSAIKPLDVMEDKPCSCMGTNPNCFKCDGLGLIRPPETAVAPTAIHDFKLFTSLFNGLPQKTKKRDGLSHRRPKKQAQNIACCLNCRATVGNLEKHYKRVHLKALAPTADKRALKCQECGLQVKNLSKHQKKVHSIKRSIKNQEEVFQQDYCTLCREWFGDIRRHLLDIHHVDCAVSRGKGAMVFSCQKCSFACGKVSFIEAHYRVKHVKIMSGRKGVLKRDGNPTATSKSFDVKENPNLLPDGSRGWGGSFRDTGQFGSHPSFDAMDDESSS